MAVTLALVASTVIAILATDLLVGIVVGVFVATLFLLAESNRNAYFLHREESADRHRVRLALAEEVTFLNEARLHAMLHGCPRAPWPRCTARPGSTSTTTCWRILHEFRTTARARDVTLRLVGIPSASAPAGAH